MKAKDIDIYKIFSKTFKGRKMFGFIAINNLKMFFFKFRHYPSLFIVALFFLLILILSLDQFEPL